LPAAYADHMRDRRPLAVQGEAVLVLERLPAGGRDVVLQLGSRYRAHGLSKRSRRSPRSTVVDRLLSLGVAAGVSAYCRLSY